MPPEGWAGVRRILAVRLDNVGDVIMLGPALRALRRELPDARITLMASPAGAQVAPMLPWVDDVLVHRAIWQDASGSMAFDPCREFGLIDELAARRFDAALVFTSFAQSPFPAAYACYLAGIALRIGQSKEFGGSVLSRAVAAPPDELHQVDRNLHLVEAAGFEADGPGMELALPPEASAAGSRLLGRAGVRPGQRYFVVAPGASCAARRYDHRRYAEAARAIAAWSGLRCVVVGNARESALAAPILEACGGDAVSLVGGTCVAELAAVIAGARVLLVNDSGPMHIADALGRPMVVLYSGTELESQWRPRSAPTVLLRRPTDCSPCYAFECPYEMQCLDIPAAEVADLALQLIEETADAERRLRASA